MHEQDTPAMAFGDVRVPQRIWRKLAVDDNGCWVWSGATGGGSPTHRYAVASLDGKLQLLHRWIYGVAVHLAGDGEHVHHECGVTRCANPAHLKALPIAEHIGQWHRDKTHCPQGHPYDDANTRVRRDGWRACRACDRERYARRKANT